MGRKSAPLPLLDDIAEAIVALGKVYDQFQKSALSEDGLVYLIMSAKPKPPRGKALSEAQVRAVIQALPRIREVWLKPTGEPSDALAVEHTQTTIERADRVRRRK